MTQRPQDTSAEEPDGGNLHVRIRRGPGRGNQPGLLKIEQVIDQRRRSIGSFEVGRLLPAGRRRLVGPFIESPQGNP